MKKILGLVLALVMILTAVSAFAADAPSSKTTSDLVRAVPQTKAVQVIMTDNNSEAVTTLLAALVGNNAIPAEAKAALPAGSTFTTVVEAMTLRLIGGTAEGDLVVNLQFPTNFAGKKVGVLLGVLDKGIIAEWRYAEATARADGSIDLKLTGELQDWLNGREFIILVLN